MIQKEKFTDIENRTTESGVPVRKLRDGDVKTQKELEDEEDLRIHNERKNGPFYPIDDLFVKYGLKCETQK
jgi:hypothetical protein